MSIKAQIIADRDQARRNGNTKALATLNYLIDQVEKGEFKKQGRVELDDTRVTQLIRTVHKNLTDTLTTVEEKGGEGMAERLADMRAEVELINSYLPALLSEADTRTLVGEIIKGGANSMGQVMGALKGREDLDRKLVASIVKEALA